MGAAVFVVRGACVVAEVTVVLFVCPGVVCEGAVGLGSNCSAVTMGAGVFLFLALTESTLVKQRQSKRNDRQSPHRRGREDTLQSK